MPPKTSKMQLKRQQKEELKQIEIKNQTNNINALKPSKPQIKKMLESELRSKKISIPSAVNRVIVSIIHNYQNYGKQMKKPRKKRTNVQTMVENLDEEKTYEEKHEYISNKMGEEFYIDFANRYLFNPAISEEQSERELNNLVYAIEQGIIRTKN